MWSFISLRWFMSCRWTVSFASFSWSCSTRFRTMRMTSMMMMTTLRILFVMLIVSRATSFSSMMCCLLWTRCMPCAWTTSRMYIFAFIAWTWTWSRSTTLVSSTSTLRMSSRTSSLSRLFITYSNMKFIALAVLVIVYNLNHWEQWSFQVYS